MCMNKKAYLVLEDGTVFEGYSFGAEKASIGELVFNTSAVGYIETLTDECYFGQIVVQTFPLIGNYGIIEEDFVGKCCLKGFVVREWCDKPSNFRCQYDLDKYLKEQGVAGIYGVDTRAITRHIRDNGTMNAVITDTVPADLTDVKNFKIVNAVSTLSNDDVNDYKAENPRFNVTYIDYGAKHNVTSELVKRGCNVKVVKYDTSADEILADKPDGIVLGDGAGNPNENTVAIAEVKKLFGNIPVFGVGLGHQILALSQGGKTEKLKYGHRGSSQPVKDLDGARTYITAQNHAYTVVNDSASGGKTNLVNVNDGTCEGIVYNNKKAFSVQFVPEVSNGPHNAAFIYDNFIKMMEEN